MEENQPLIGSKEETGKVALSKFSLFAPILVSLVVGVAVGVFFSLFALPDASEKVLVKKLTSEADPKINQKLMDEIKAYNIREYLRNLTAEPHLAGTPADKKQAEELAAFWRSNGINPALVPYNVLLSYPDPNRPNRIELQDGDGNVLYTTQLEEKIVRPEQNHPDVVPPFSAYSAPGSPRGDLIFVNYGRVEDFTWLKENKSIDFTGKICIARYGQIYRGDIAQNAESFGALGLILYTDPKDYSPQGWYTVYPDSWWMPGTGVQRGFCYSDDPRTPGYPDIESSYAIDQNDTTLPRIPIHPIGYDDAYHLLSDLGGETAPPDWQGNLNFTYRIGPGYLNSQNKVQMHISTSNQNATTYDVIGFIEGCIEPDRYVVMGNTRDTWVFGAIGPGSGTAVMKEISRSLAKLMKEGWCPRRTIVFCSWGAEVYGIGSREWVEQYGHILGDRTVAYLNLASAVKGDYALACSAMPLLFDIIYDAAKSIPSPHGGGKSMYDVWVERRPNKNRDGSNTGTPIVGKLGSGGDYEHFVGKVGITSADFGYDWDPDLGLTSYPLYNTAYDTFHLYSTFIDPDFKISRAIGQFMGEMFLRLADSYFIPFNVEQYGPAIEIYIREITDKYGNKMAEKGLNQRLGYLQVAVQDFVKATKEFSTRVSKTDKRNPFVVRQINDQMMMLDRKFIDPQGLPGRPLARNIVFAPSTHNSYVGSTFPGLVDTLFEIEKLTGDEEVKRWEEVGRQLSIVTYFIRNAAAGLQDPMSFHQI